MKTRALALLAAVLPFAGMISCGSSNGETRVPVPTADNSSATALFNDVNRYRGRLGKPALVRHAGLDALAQQHSRFMMQNRGRFKLSKSGNLSHDGFESRSALARQKYDIVTFHENVAAGPRGTSLTRTWALSRSHEPAMRGAWSYTGVGVAVDKDGMVFATQLFGAVGTPRMLQQRFGSY